MQIKITMVLGIAIIAVAVILIASIDQYYVSIEGQKLQGVIDEKINESVKQVEQQNYEGALNTYYEILKIDPENLMAHRGIGDIHLLKGQMSLSYDYHENGMQIAKIKGVESNPFKIGMANALKLSNPQEAINLYNTVLSTDESNVNALNGISHSHLILGNLEKAKIFCNKSLQIQPSNNPNAQIACANVLREKGQIQDSISLYQQILEEHPDHTMTLFSLATAKFNSGNYDEAIALIQKGIQNEPNYNPEILITLAESFEHIGDVETAKNYYAQASKQIPVDHFNYDFLQKQIKEKLEEK